MFDCWTEKRWKIIRTSEDLAVGNFSLLVNPAGWLASSMGIADTNGVISLSRSAAPNTLLTTPF